MNNHVNYKVSDKVSSVIANDFRLLQVMSRFGISLGFGDKNIQEVCLECDVEPHTFITVINFVKNGGVDNDIDEQTLDLRCMLHYLKRTHQYFLDYQFPKMRRDMLNAIDCSVKNEVAFLVLKFYDEYVEEVRKHMDFEEQVTFNYVERILEGKQIPKRKNNEVNPLLSHHHDEIEDKLMDLKRLFIQYYPQKNIDLDINDVVYELYRTQEDLLMHCKVEDCIFIPAVKYQEAQLASRIKSDTTQENDVKIDSDNELSDRERDVVVCVAKGMSNKEIADKLCLSVNTVTTHRRNIARKLSIHTSAGITIYAIVNKLVTLEEVNI